jgi:acyl transferase domain-containing protein/acyl-CoA thioesterase FadM
MDMAQSLADLSLAGSPIAIIGMGCWLPGAADPRQLWENVLARRREFRRMPDVRTPLSDYHDPTGNDPDKFYQSKVAVIDGFEFDWASYRIPESSYVTTDVSQWLALEIAQRALVDAGFSRATVPKDRTGVFIGNTCTGEGMRSNSLRLRWPTVQRAMVKAAELQGVPTSDLSSFMKTAESCYKSIFPAMSEDFVAGSISATIAGRVCNYFDFHGGAFVIDGACASSLATVVTAANMLSSHDLDLALAGGIDISLDPFELVGFSRNGALSKSEIRPYDRRGDGFIAGEGGGLVVMKRLADAQRDGDSIYAVIRGWGLASDGRAGIMQPVASQQAAAIRRAVARAGIELTELDFIEGHGTGTRAGDRTEIEGLSLAMADSNGNGNAQSTPVTRTCGIGSLKSLIGHTKATAGVASLIKAVAAVNRRVLPPTASCHEPNDAFNTTAARLFPMRLGEVRPAEDIVRAGVSAFGFGGINTHLIIESGGPPSPKLAPQIEERALLVSEQESEIFVFRGRTKEEVMARVQAVLDDAPALSQSDLVDLAASLATSLANELPDAPSFRAAVVAETADDLAAKLRELLGALAVEALAAGKTPQSPGGSDLWAMPHKGVYIGKGGAAARIGFLFPGQGAHQLLMARTLIERFDWARQLAAQAQLAVTGGSLLDVIYRPIDRARDTSEVEAWTRSLAATEVAQPAICLASVLCARFLQSLGIQPAVVGGHSLGEITALHVAGAFDAETLFAVASLRGQVLRARPERKGAMASLACPRADVDDLLPLISGTVVVANLNSPNQTVVSGDVEAIEAVIAAAASRNIACRRLPVSNAFHSPLVAEGAGAFEAALHALPSLPAAGVAAAGVPVVSSVESVTLDETTDLRQHLTRQITSPVNFIALAKEARRLCDVLIEVGPGRTLSGLCRDIFGEEGICTPLATDALKWNPNPAVAVAFVNGADINWKEFYSQRLVRMYVKPSMRLFLSNPAEHPITVKSASSAPATSALLESALNRELGSNAKEVAEYLQQRGAFLAGVARLDMASFGSTSASRSDVGATRREAEAPVPVQVLPVTASAVSSVARAAPFTLENVTALLVDVAARRTGYPAASITAESRLLDDLNLDSIKAGELVAEALRAIGAAGAIDATRFANSPIRVIGEALYEVAPKIATVEAVTEPVAQLDSRPAIEGLLKSPQSPGGSESDTSFVSRYPTWTRSFRVRAAPKPREVPGGAPEAVADARDTSLTGSVAGALTGVLAGALAGARFLVLFDANDRAPADALCAEITAHGGFAEQTAFDAPARAALQRDGRFTHQLALLPRVPGEGTPAARVAEMISRVISLAHTPVSTAPTSRATTVAYVQFGGGFFGSESTGTAPELCNALAFARTLHLERKDLRVRVLDFAKSIAPSTLASAVLDELAFGGGTADSSFAALGFDEALIRRVPVAELCEPETWQPRGVTWSERDVILVTGGAKGIMAECALGVARETGATLALMGRGEPGSGDGEIERTLERFRSEGLRHVYCSCDIVDLDALARAIRKIEVDAGPITGVIHGASILRPSRTDNLTVDGVLQEVSPKILGAWNLCRALQGRPLKQFVAISSLVVDHGMPWSAGYAFANEVMERVLQARAGADATFPLQIVSFGLWGQVGRPAALKTNDHLLSVGLHDGEIPPEEGVRRFVEAFVSDTGERSSVRSGERSSERSGTPRICIYGRSVGYGTWDQLRPVPTIPPGLRFIERVSHFEPEVELIARFRLTLERDLYLHDHVYNGMYIVPTVLALEIVAQAAYALAGDTSPLCRLEAVEMPYPIVVDPTHGLDIELRAEAQEASTSDELRRVNVFVSTAQSGFKTCALSGTVVFGRRAAETQSPVALGTPLTIDARADLYGRQFFVGPRYQRMGAIHSVDPKQSVCVGEVHAEPVAAREAFSAVDGSAEDQLVLGDPFFRDTLLHTSLLHHLDHMAFTSRIDRVELFDGCEAEHAGQRLCVARLLWSEGKDAEYELVAVSTEGRILERWSGYCTKALASTGAWPALEDLLDTNRTQVRDERELIERVTSAASRLGVVVPSVALECIKGFSGFPVTARHDVERTLSARAVASAIPGTKSVPPLEWLSNGRPHFDAPTDLDVSFSHEGSYCLCAVGSGAQGCDLAALSEQDYSDWICLFGVARERLLVELSADESLDVAATRVWAALEAVRKAFGTHDEELTVVERAESSVLFRARTSDKEAFVLTLPIRFSHGPESIVALTVRKSRKPAAHASVAGRLRETERVAPAARIVRDEVLGCDVLEYEFSVTWKECMTPSRKAMAACYVEWFHKAREAMLAPEDARRWVALVLDGTVGLVARSIHVQVHDEVTAHDELRARVWMTRLSESGANWRVEYFKKTPQTTQDTRRLVAVVEAEGRVVGRGGDEAMRDYGRFVQTRPSIAPRPSVARAKDGAGFDELHRGRPIFEGAAGPRGGPVLFVETMRPSLIDSDLIGNVSSITFFGWLAHVRDRFLHSVVPHELARREGASSSDRGEALCLDEEMTYLREAFPFDDIAVEMRLSAATERSARIRYEFIRKKPGSNEKVATGHQELLWVRRDGAGAVRSETFPSELLRLLHPTPPIEDDEISRRAEGAGQ